MRESRIKVGYFSDILCVWAYISQIRLDHLKSKFAGKVEIKYHFISLFGDAEKRLQKRVSGEMAWSSFNQHVREVAAGFDHCEINPEIWLSCRPLTSANSHLFLKAIQLLEKRQELPPLPADDENGNNRFEDMIWRVRCAFFCEALDIGRFDVLYSIGEQAGLPLTALESVINDGAAMAALHADAELGSNFKLEGSPTFLLNDGRQKLYGNVGYKIIEANINELLSFPGDRASWC